MTYTVVECGDFYNQESPDVRLACRLVLTSLQQPAELFWFPWMNPNQDSFDVPVIGNADALIDWCHTADLAQYVCSALARPALTANRALNVPSATCSHNDVVGALRTHCARPVNVVHIPVEDAHRFVKEPAAAPRKLHENTRFPVDFWFVVKSVQAEGRARRLRAELHNGLFPEVKPTSFEQFFAHHFSK